jgi:hypothetical protein
MLLVLAAEDDDGDEAEKLRGVDYAGAPQIDVRGAAATTTDTTTTTHCSRYLFHTRHSRFCN